MNIKQKLEIIKQLSGATQEELARKLKVSFPTLNSWINLKSLPRKAKILKIDELYFEVTGQKEVKGTTLAAKKDIIAEKRTQTKAVLSKILKRKDIYDQLMLSLTYNTNRIEGSTLTEPETAAILFDNVSLPNRNIIEQMEVKNHQAALFYLLNNLGNNKKITEDLIMKLHAMLMNGIQSDAGFYRNHGVRIVGVNVPTANYLRVPEKMKEFVKRVNQKSNDVIRHCVVMHSIFEQIHPFSDGNGRIGRLIIHAMLIKENYAPAVIKQEKKRFYLKFLNNAQIKDDFNGLEEFLCDAVLEGYRIVES